jgi:hypothetical protein
MPLVGSRYQSRSIIVPDGFSHIAKTRVKKWVSEMKYTIVATVTALAVGAAASAQAKQEPFRYSAAQSAGSSASPEVAASKTYPAAGSVASLNALLTEWDQAGFNSPSKPGQYRVYGRNGSVISGPGYNAMVSLIRSAVRDAREGRSGEASTTISKARSLLAATNSARSTT